MTDFLHGAEFIEVEYGFRPIQVARASIIGLVGTAPEGPINDITLIRNLTEAMTTFGDDETYTIPSALKTIFAQGNMTSLVCVVNVFDPETHVEGEEPDPTKVEKNDIIGGVDAGTGKRQGIEALLDAQSRFGYKPKLLIAPTYSHDADVQGALQDKADALRSIAYLDSEFGTTQSDMLTAVEGITGQRLFSLYPWVGARDDMLPPSPYWAAVTARTDNTLGWWWSPSNKLVYGMSRLEHDIDFGISDPNSWANLLNEKGVGTFINHQGWRTWGNRMVNADPKFQFMNVRRIFDIVMDSLESVIIWFIDRPINKAFFEDVTDAENAFLNYLVGRGALIAGKCWYLPEENPPENIANGQVTFNVSLTPVYPAERITHRMILDIGPLAEIFG